MCSSLRVASFCSSVRSFSSPQLLAWLGYSLVPWIECFVLIGRSSEITYSRGSRHFTVIPHGFNAHHIRGKSLLQSAYLSCPTIPSLTSHPQSVGTSSRALPSAQTFGDAALANFHLHLSLAISSAAQPQPRRDSARKQLEHETKVKSQITSYALCLAASTHLSEQDGRPL